MTIMQDIQSRIYTIRGVQVMLDRDLATLYDVETRVLNQAVKRNNRRFPNDFCFQLTENEFMEWKSQIVMSDADRMGLRRPPYAFTEQGVAMLSTVLKSRIAVDISVKIIKAFVAMRRIIASNALLFQRLDNLEVKQLETDKKIEKVLSAFESGEVRPKQGVFFDGQVFDAHLFVSDLFRSAERSIMIIDNYLDDSVLTHLAKRKKGVSVLLLTRNLTEDLALDVEKFNSQYPGIEARRFDNSHDRFIIIDGHDVYHFGASLKDLGKRWFAFSKMDIGAAEMLARLGKTG
jgi:hypothetical protein